MTNRSDSNTDYRELRRLLLQARDEIDEVLEAIASLERDRDNDFMLYLEVGKIKAKVTEAANELLPENPDYSVPWPDGFDPWSSLEDEADEDEIIGVCDGCVYYTENLHLVCAVHPTGPVGDSCPDYDGATEDAVQFPLDTPYENPWNPDSEENWSPLGTRYVDGELVFSDSE